MTPSRNPNLPRHIPPATPLTPAELADSTSQAILAGALSASKVVQEWATFVSPAPAAASSTAGTATTSGSKAKESSVQPEKGPLIELSTNVSELD